MKTTNKPTAFNIVLCVVTLLVLIMADVLAIVALTISPMWGINIINAIFWSFILLGVLAFVNMFVLGMWKETFNKQ